MDHDRQCFKTVVGPLTASEPQITRHIPSCQTHNFVKFRSQVRETPSSQDHIEHAPRAPLADKANLLLPINNSAARISPAVLPALPNSTKYHSEAAQLPQPRISSSSPSPMCKTSAQIGPTVGFVYVIGGGAAGVTDIWPAVVDATQPVVTVTVRGAKSHASVWHVEHGPATNLVLVFGQQ